MPEISRFFGILISMYYNDHPPPHFHAKYGSDTEILAEAPWELTTAGCADIISNYTAVKDWRLAEQREPLTRIAPLE